MARRAGRRRLAKGSEPGERRWKSQHWARVSQRPRVEWRRRVTQRLLPCSRQESPARRRVHQSPRSPEAVGTGVVAEPAGDAGGAMNLGTDRLSVSRALVDGVPRRLPFGGGMTSDDTVASTLGDSLGAVQTTEGETGGGSAIVGGGAESIVGSVGSTADGGVAGDWSTTVPATAATTTTLASAARPAPRVQSNRDRWTSLTSMPVSAGMTFGVGSAHPAARSATATAPTPGQSRRAPRSSPPTESALEMPSPTTVDGADAIGREGSHSCHRPNE